MLEDYATQKWKAIASTLKEMYVKDFGWRYAGISKFESNLIQPSCPQYCWGLP